MDAELPRRRPVRQTLAGLEEALGTRDGDEIAYASLAIDNLSATIAAATEANRLTADAIHAIWLLARQVGYEAAAGDCFRDGWEKGRAALLAEQAAADPPVPLRPAV